MIDYGIYAAYTKNSYYMSFEAQSNNPIIMSGEFEPYYYIVVDSSYYVDMYLWCEEQFGPPGSRWILHKKAKYFKNNFRLSQKLTVIGSL